MKTWNDLTFRGKGIRIVKALQEADSACVDSAFSKYYNDWEDLKGSSKWEAVEAIEKARDILLANAKNGGKLGVAYPKQHKVIELLQ